MKSLLFAFVTMVCVTSTLQCRTDEDCPLGCCAFSVAGNECKHMGKLGDICDLEREHQADGVCSCEAGFECQKIDLTDISPIAASANPILEKFHYGMCAEKIIIG